jgi:hypothetical protein
MNEFEHATYDRRKFLNIGVLVDDVRVGAVCCVFHAFN